MPSPPPDPERPSASPWRSAALGAGFVVCALVSWRACFSALEDEDVPEDAAAPSPTVSATSSAASPLARCAPLQGSPGFVIGEGAAAAQDDAGEEDDEPELSPFAVEVGRAVTTKAGGFAVGALRAEEGGSVATVILLGGDGANGRAVKLARSRGDMDAPVVAALGDAVLAAMLEPNAGGRALRLAEVVGDRVRWGLELAQGRDESLAYDLAASATRGVIAWDDPTPDGKRSSIVLATFEPATLRGVDAPHPITDGRTDAEAPRVSVRPGGFWATYIVHGEVSAPRKKTARGEPDEEDQGEFIGPSWVEVVPLDEQGRVAAPARRISPADGHVLAYDVEPRDDGDAVVAWRDDDTPSGSSGGRVSTAVVSLGGIGEANVVAEDSAASGVPDLLGPWLALSDLRRPKQLARLDARGALEGELAAEPSIGHGEPLAAADDRVLVAQPAGRAMRLSVVRCAATVGRLAP